MVGSGVTFIFLLSSKKGEFFWGGKFPLLVVKYTRTPVLGGAFFEVLIDFKKPTSKAALDTGLLALGFWDGPLP